MENIDVCMVVDAAIHLTIILINTIINVLDVEILQCIYTLIVDMNHYAMNVTVKDKNILLYNNNIFIYIFFNIIDKLLHYHIEYLMFFLLINIAIENI